jgi:hypothetical protein
MTGWSSSSDGGDSEVAAAMASAPAGGSSGSDSSSHSRSRSRSPRREDDREQQPNMLVDFEGNPAIAYWQKPLLAALEDLRVQRARQGLLRPIVLDSLCSGIGSEVEAFQAPSQPHDASPSPAGKLWLLWRLVQRLEWGGNVCPILVFERRGAAA